MKKVYLSLLLAGFATSASYAQVNSKPVTFGEVNEAAIKPTQTQNQSKALGVMIWEDVFNSAANWTIDNDGQTGSEFGWTIDATNDGWWSVNGITSSSGGGFAELANGDPTATVPSQALNVTYTMTSISLDVPNLAGNTSNTDQVTLEFEQYGARFNDEQTVQISNDGGSTWTVIRDNADFSSVLSAGGGSAYPNPELVSINLAPYITGNANDVQIRFQWTTAFPASGSNPNVWVTYGWYIDDVRIFTNPDNDIESQEPFWGTAGLNYSQIPTTQLAPITFTSFAFNNGLNTQTDVTLEVDVNSGLWTGASTPVDIAVGDRDSLFTATEFTPAAITGNYSFTWEITQNETDDVPANNVITGDAFEVTDWIYAMDDDVLDGSTGNGGFGFEKGNFYDVWADQSASYIDIKLASNTVVGSTVYGKIYRWDPTNATTFADALFYEQQTNFHQVTQADLTGGVISLPLLAATPLTANTSYFVVAVSDGDGGATDDVQIGTSGISPTGFSYFYAADDDAWYLQPQTPVVRLNFENDLGLNDLSNVSALNIFPNPATDNVNVSFNITDASDVKVEVLDLTGKVIETVANDSNVTGMQESSVNTAAYAAGVYVINITTNEGSLQRKFVKK